MSETKRGYYNNGQLAYEYPYVNGKLHGTRRYWHDNGQLWYERPYVGGKAHGIHRYWYDNGQLRYEWPCVNGKPHGIHRYWDYQGKLINTEHYLYGDQVTQAQYRKHELITELSGLNDE